MCMHIKIKPDTYPMEGLVWIFYTLYFHNTLYSIMKLKISTIYKRAWKSSNKSLLLKVWDDL